MRELRDVPWWGSVSGLGEVRRSTRSFVFNMTSSSDSAGYVSAMPLMPKTLCRRLFCL